MIEKFIKTPIQGDIVKVYLNKNDFTFGIVIRVENGIDQESGKIREIVILKNADHDFTLNETDYFLPKSKVGFIQ